MAITAPFRFARINRWVHFPDWADAVSHDLPFKDGYCGEIAFTLTTRTPLLLGGARRKPNKQDETSGEVWPFVDADGRLAIPGSSIQGMIRSILEVATFAKLGPWVAKRRFGVRDIQKGVTAEQLYRSRVVGQVTPGWLVREDDALIVYGCSVKPILINDIKEVLGLVVLPPILRQQSDAKKRLESITVSNGKRTLDRLEVQVDGVDCTLVLTGKPQDNFGQGAKTKEFLFHTPCRKQFQRGTRREVPPDVWTDFLLIHDQNTGKNAQPNPNWEFWKGEFEAGRPVPVFTLGDSAKVSDIGTAQMFKLAMELSTHHLLKNSSPDHLDPSRFDLPSLIFGATGEEGGTDPGFAHNLKRRASIDMAKLRKGQSDAIVRNEPAILLSPKPNYYPIYVRQAKHLGDTLPRGEPYAAYADTKGTAPETRQPELAGVKVWPNSGSPNILTHDSRKLMPVSNRLNTVPEGKTFESAVRVHNLREVELGALLWAMTFGEASAFVETGAVLPHRLGGGKPFGLGEIELRIGALNLVCNDGRPTKDGPALIRAFVEYMRKQPKLSDWCNSIQVRALRKTAKNNTEPEALRYLDGYQGYARERRSGSIFPDFLAQNHGVVELDRTTTNAAKQGTSEKAAANQPSGASSGPPQVGVKYKCGPQTGTLVKIVNARQGVLELSDRRRVPVALSSLIRV